MTDGWHPQTASEWLVALQDSPDNPQMRSDFATWLAADDANLRDWREVSRTYELLGELGALRSAPIPSGLLRRQPAISRRLAIGLVGTGLAAAVALMLATSYIFTHDADFVTAKAEVKGITLADGSRVDLGPESALALDFSEERRIVRLMSGEAFFQVASDAARPFRVVTKSLEARVVGTAFEVQLVEDTTTVAVQEGVVDVSPAGRVTAPERLAAGGRLHLTDDGRVERDQLPPDQVATWRKGRLVVKDRPLSEVVSLLRRYHSGIIAISSGDLGAETLTGAYNLDDPVAALRAMAGSHDAKLREFTPWVLVLSR